MTIDNVKYVSPTPGTSTNNPSIVEGSAQVIGGKNILLVESMSARDLLESILIELRKLNLRQEEVFEETVNEEDI